MAKRKKKKFTELATFPNVIHIPLREVEAIDFHLKGKWALERFNNSNPLVLEAGCGKGEYTLALAGRHPEKNYIGVDIKGDRLWRGAKTAIELKLRNILFIRTYAEWLPAVFGPSEIKEMWLTFPDPYPKSSKAKKRLTSPQFLEKYHAFLSKGAVIHLKTDNRQLFEYSKTTVQEVGGTIVYQSDDIHADQNKNDILTVTTFYEKMWLAKGMKICYLQFTIS